MLYPEMVSHSLHVFSLDTTPKYSNYKLDTASTLRKTTVTGGTDKGSHKWY